MKKRTIYWWVPLFIGCLIYASFRTDYLIYNKLLGNLFTPLTSTDTFLERVIIFSLPSGLWAMSYGILIFHIRKNKTSRTIIWSLIIPFIGVFFRD